MRIIISLVVYLRIYIIKEILFSKLIDKVVREYTMVAKSDHYNEGTNELLICLIISGYKGNLAIFQIGHLEGYLS